MTHSEALELIRPAVIGQTWADLGAGSGNFTRVLANRKPNPWVPYPIRHIALSGLLAEAGYTGVEKVATRASRFGGEMYLLKAQCPVPKAR
jgi:hypothetical protein